ncbi:DNA-directed RNA polymerase [Teratosphaeriaceae sp. CCFEE 6253]|nr:DNA-directed RNA polymerase [Teratosphaeriaceae sp. CCFEE 6253]
MKLNGRLTRKCVKQPVMTNVYGVTFFGAKQQVQRQLQVLFPEVRAGDEVNLDSMSLYVATKIFQSLGQMFSGAQAIQHWLGTCADRIATCLTPEQVRLLTDPEIIARKAELAKTARPKKALGTAATGKGNLEKIKAGTIADPPRGSDRVNGGSALSDRRILEESRPLFRSTVVWTTPLRLPVVQPYRKSVAKTIYTGLQTVKLQEPQVWDPVSKRKQLQAFPPNFIHSLDATHMLLSALKCNEEGMTFAAIHDSFWTHAADVDHLSVLLRDAFVEMHSEDIIGRLREEFETRYRGCMYLAPVAAKSVAGEKMAVWRRENKTGRTGKSGELQLEAQRLRLLASSEPGDKERGAAMVTPASLFSEANGGEGDLLAPAEMRGQALGDLPDTVDVEETNSDTDELLDEPDDGALAAAPGEGVVGGSVLDTDTAGLAEAGSGLGDDEAAPASAKGVKAKAKKRYPRKTYVWLPMTFPEVPEKGAFDVTRLRARVGRA